MTDRDFFLGGIIDPATGDRTNADYSYESADLTTHAVIVGMTGSGKTGLGVAFIEEATLAGIPCLVIDPKGDMTNLALNFPELRPADFRAWVDVAAAGREGKDPDQVAEETASRWKTGLESWNIDSERMQELHRAADVTIYTPGSKAGTPINIVGGLTVPPIGWASNEETLRDEIEGYVSSLLTLAGITADPVAAPEHILLARIIEHAWSNGSDLDLAGLIGAVIEPPIRKLGVFDIDTFFPKKDRTALAMRLNALVASPSFASWIEGRPLDIESMLYKGDSPRVSVIYLSHLSDDERQFVVTLVLSKLVTWMRKQAGTGALRALVYMDEMFGFAPPTAEPPSKKPILTILKQARAYGVGMILSTQNPVNLDYKAMANAGTWMIGRLQTERDKTRILAGMSSAAGGSDLSDLGELISGLGKRAFVAHSTRSDTPTVFTTRWVMSYLAGPLTRDQVAELKRDPQPVHAVPTIPEEPVSDDASLVAPPVADGIGVAWTAPSVPWVEEAGGLPGSRRLAPAAVARIHLRYNDQRAGIEHEEEYEAVVYPLDDGATHVTAVDHDERDFLPNPPDRTEYVLGTAGIAGAAFWRSLSTALTNRLMVEKTITVFKNTELKLYSRVEEDREHFEQRCRAAAAERADADVAALTAKYQTRIRTAQDAIRKAEHRVRELESDVGARKQTELLSGAGDLLGALLGGKRTATGLRSAASRRNQTRRVEERRDTAADRLEMQQDALVNLESDLAGDVEDITGKWETAATQVEEAAIPLARSNVEVEPLRLLWLPVE